MVPHDVLLTLAGEVFRAQVAGIGAGRLRPLVVGALVEQQVPLQREGLSAFLTGKGSISCVRTAEKIRVC